jgi:two-component system cell cycle response regulator DivK
MTKANPYIVIVVDDSADGREMLSEYLAYRGIAVVEAADGESALKLAHERKPVLILMDLQMAGVDGWEATRRLKADPTTKDIIVVAVTAHAMQPDEAIARQAGCDGFIAKPFDIVSVGDAVAEIVTRGRRGLGAIHSLKPPEGHGTTVSTA